MTPEPTTAALCTAPGRGGIAVITLIGPSAEEILASVFRPIGAHAIVPENALQLGHLVDPSGAALDKVIVCRTPGGVEINIHGGPHIARRSLELLARLGAQPHNCDADLDGPLNAAHEKWNNPAVGSELLGVLPDARSTLVVGALSAQWSGGLSRLAAGELPEPERLGAAAGGLKVIDRLLSPAEVVLAGPPNAGKSTLANALVGREVSIVHQTAGTTRDWVREPAVINGVPIWLTDTAGLWDAPEGIDSEAVRRARQCAAEADVVILLDPDAFADAPVWLDRTPLRGDLLRVTTKCDEPAGGGPRWRIEISAVTGRGLDELKDAIVAALGLANFDAKAPRAFTARQAELLTRAADAIEAGNPLGARESLDELLRGRTADAASSSSEIT